MNMKALIEKRNALVEEVNALFAQAESEVRAMTEEENAKYDSLTAEIKGLDDMISKAERSFQPMNVPQDQVEERAEEQEEPLEARELRQFATFVRENRAGEMKVSENGAVIPTTIANKIIDKVKTIAPLYALATKYNVKGDLTFPVDKGTQITTAYQEEFTELTSSTVGFNQVKLGGYLVGALSKVSMSLINNAQFDIVGYVTNKVAESIALFLEKELINGTSGKMQGLLADGAITQKVEATTAITADDLIETQCLVPQALQDNCRWLVNNKTLVAMRKMKDANGQYLLNPDIRTGFGYTFLGKPVMVSDQMADDKVVYGDFSAMYINVHEDISIKVLQEKYIAEHAVGVIAWLEMDSKVVEPQKLAICEKK